MKIVLSSVSLETASDLQLALYYLKSYLLKHARPLLRSADVPVRVFSDTHTAAHIAGSILREKPELVGFSCYLWNITLTLEVCRLLKRARPGMRIVLGGPEVSPRAEALLRDELAVDIIVRGEGEVTFCRLVEALRSGAPLRSCAGVSFRENGRTVSAADRPNITDLSVIPSPYLTGLIDLKDKTVVDVPLETTRGCSFRCRYCYYHKNFPKLRFFPLKRVEAELKYILRHRPTEVYLMDATFNADHGRAMEILGLFKKYNRGSSLHVELMAEMVDEPMARALAEANASQIEIGLQSADAAVLAAVRRPFNQERFRRGIALLNRYGVLYEIQLIDALPLQRYEHILSALDWLYALHPCRVDVFSLCVLPGTTLAGECRGYGIVYDQRAPYRVKRTAALSAAQLKRVRLLRYALDRLYDSEVFRPTLYALKERLGIPFSSVFDAWVDWQQRLPVRLRNDAQKLNRRLPQFLAYVLRRHRRSALLPQLSAQLEATLAEYRKSYGG